ncbi:MULTISPECIES: serine/threonine-protein kinase [Streptomyces]|uniref:Serine/threonine protein kinase n=1 Tax=Streptomyces dengpaensis TaxID=2049881 RepID=A0ABN5HXE2_9ACTN|nr:MULTISPECIES: serine/threonine-protein kinase [Streptomyces]AVH55378.1 serine/threonine protein kinase [Streptomyces dengpaensis]PIB07024.1 serine/threonine protein kinase [Streptomyces sp. HG99]
MRRSLGRYELTHELGRGGMGVVWAAYDRDHGREVAIKLLAPRSRSAELTTLERRFLREARLTSRLDHPGIPAVHDHGSHEGELYLVMDLVPGRALDAVLESDGPLAVEHAADVARRAADVLAYAHGQSVVHRDLKPSNLMITPGCEIKVLDFGVAAALEPQPGETRFTAANATPGTVVYMAPEQAVGKTVPASDLYSLGCVLYELLTGTPPFTDGSPFMLYHRHANEPVPPLAERRSGVPTGLQMLVAGLLEKKPEDRPASAAEVAALLAAWAPARTTAAATALAHPRLTEIAALRQSGHPARALEEYGELMAAPGLGRADFLTARAGAALCVGALGRTREALDELKSVLAEQRSLLGPGDPAVLDTRYEIAVLLVRTGERHAAAELVRRLADDEDRVLPEGDTRHGRSRMLLGRLRRMA